MHLNCQREGPKVEYAGTSSFRQDGELIKINGAFDVSTNVPQQEPNLENYSTIVKSASFFGASLKI